MNEQEICITKHEIEDSNGNLKTLISNWAKVPVVPEATLTKSRGDSATCVRWSMESTQQVDRAFAALLDSTLQFLDKAGVAFEESDMEATSNINTITQK